MNPEILEVSDKNNILSFKLNGVNMSIANSIRRVILSEIPIVVFRTTPYEKNDANFAQHLAKLADLYHHFWR